MRGVGRILLVGLVAWGKVVIGHAEDAVAGLTPQQIVMQARAMFPQEHVAVEGRVGTAERRGQREVFRPYSLELNWAGGIPTARCRLYRLSRAEREPLLEAELSRRNGKPILVLIASDGSRVEDVRLNTPIGESDLTWMDLAFDYLWWPEVRQLEEAELEECEIPTRVSGREAVVLETTPPAPIAGLSAVRMWVDVGTGNLLQVSQLDEQKREFRQMYVQRIGREEGRWVPREFRVRRKGESRITRLLVSSVKTDTFSAAEEDE